MSEFCGGDLHWGGTRPGLVYACTYWRACRQDLKVIEKLNALSHHLTYCHLTAVTTLQDISPPPLCGVRTVKASVIRMNVLSHCLRQFIESNEDVTRTKINQNGRIILTVCDMAQNITLYVISILHYVTEILITSVTWAMQCRPLPTLPSHTVCNSAPTIEFLYVDGATTSVDGCANERPFDSATPSNDNTSPPMDIETYLTYLNVLFSFATAHTWL